MKEKTYILSGPDYVFHFPEGTTMGELYYNQLQTFEDKVAQIQVDTNEQLTFKQLFDKSVKLAIYLKNRGIQVNDRIGIFSENNLSWAPIMCANLFIGATMCPLNPMYSKREFLHTINISKPKIIFASPKTLRAAKSFVKELSWSPIIILMLNDSNTDTLSIDQLIVNIPSKDVENFEVTKVNPENHIVCILCSSGTTGLPKGVMLNDKNYLALMQTTLSDSEIMLKTDKPIICLLPLFHAYSFAVSILGFIAGHTAIVFSQFNEEQYLETIAKYQINLLTMVPPLMVFLAKHPMVEKYDLSCVKTIWCGAAPLSRNVEIVVKKRLNNPTIKQGYGMTEMTLSVLRAPNEVVKLGSVGKLLPGVLGKVIPIDESGKWSDKTLGPNCEGELCFKGDLIMKGYCGDRQSTSATIDEDGWLHSGDVGYYDEDGYFYIVDRVKELIKYKGFQVPPAELEAILLSHPEIKDAAVVGLPHEEVGELPIAFVVKQANAKIVAEDVVKYVNERVSNIKRLRGGVRFLDDIPKNPSGKILRRELRNLLKSKL